MTLGARIFRYRTQRNMSQGDLADALGVSRQSVSKWETDSSVPDLDKLIKLSSLFEVTLDELAKGDPPFSDKQAAPPPAPTESGTPLPGRKIAGIILFSMAFLILLLITLLFGDLLSALMLALPFTLCGAICCIFRKNVGLWCAWGLTFLLDLYLTFATGVNWRSIFVYFQGYLPFTWTATTIISLLHLLLMLTISIITIIRFRKGSPFHRSLPLFSYGTVLLLLSVFGEKLLFQTLINAADRSTQFSFYMSLISVLNLMINWIQLSFVIFLLIVLYRLILSRKVHNEQ